MLWFLLELGLVFRIWCAWLKLVVVLLTKKAFFGNSKVQFQPSLLESLPIK